MKRLAFLDQLPELAARLRAAGLVLSGEAAAHVHLAAATQSVPGEPPRYAALPPRSIEAIGTADAVQLAGIALDTSPVAGVVRERLDLFGQQVVLADGTAVPTLRREAILAELLARAGLAIALAGSVVGVARLPPIDPDEVRELLKAARQGERFQPLLELMDVA